MDINEAYNNIEIVRNKLLEIQKIASLVVSADEGKSENNEPHFDTQIDMSQQLPDENKQLHDLWSEIQKIAPPGFSISSNLLRHLSFNLACDWSDISKFDVPNELQSIEVYKKQLALIEFLETLHPEIRRVSQLVLIGDIDAALKTVFATLESVARKMARAKPGESTVPQIGKAFKEGILATRHDSHTDSVRNFLQGVIGFYRSVIIHNKLPAHRNSINASLSLFCLAHEAFIQLESCNKQVLPNSFG